MKKKTRSPAISSLKWGEVKTSDGKTYKDAKLYPGGSRAWDWNETGTHHRPGILPADVQELLDHNAQVLILSKGINERLQTSDETISLLEQKNIPYHILQTEQAVSKYNDLRKEYAVGALIHSTC
ncbi:MAG: Mth938-like domain-containing protein [Balneolaceae bacterium]|nr:Mth938-like domain-containing protein [Balneolaceae bacterium]